MGVDLRGRSFVKLLDHTAEEVTHLLDTAAAIRSAPGGGGPQHLRGRTIALIFEKTSTRTRIAFEVAAYDQGAHVTYLGPSGTQIGHKESMRDTARVLGRVYDAIQYRGFGQDVVEELAAHAGVPVYNGLTDEFHPTQFLADALTMRDHADRDLRSIACCYLGDARNNVSNSLLVGGALLGMDVRFAAPESLWPPEDLVARCRELAEDSGARITISADPDEVVPGADFLYTDVWVSMGEPEAVWERRIDVLTPYRVDAARMEQAGSDTRFLHCLPAFHDRRTTIGERMYERFGLEAMEVTDEVFESDASVVFDQAHNRLHTIEALLVETLRRD